MDLATATIGHVLPASALAPAQVVVPDATEIRLDGFDVQSITGVDLLFAGIALVGGFVLSRLAKRGLSRFFRNLDGMPEDAGVLISRIVGYLILLIGLFVALEALGFSWGPLGGLLLLILVVVVLSAKPLLEDLGAGLVLQVRQPFNQGDLVDLDATRGEVVEVTSRTVVVDTIDGERVHVPSRLVLNDAIRNLSSGHRRLSTFVAGVEYATDLDNACAIATEAMAAAPGVLPDPAPEALVEEFADSTINISCRFWHDADELAALRTRDEAMRAVKRRFADDGVVIAFPQRVLWSGTDQR